MKKADEVVQETKQVRRNDCHFESLKELKFQTGNMENPTFHLSTFITEIPINVMYCFFEPRKSFVRGLLVYLYASMHFYRNLQHCCHQGDKWPRDKTDLWRKKLYILN